MSPPMGQTSDCLFNHVSCTSGLSIRKKESPLMVDNLCVGYQDVDVLSGISFSAYPGETLALMGTMAVARPHSCCHYLDFKTQAG